MGLLSLVFKKTQRTRIEGSALDGSPIVLEIDATTTMNHERTATPTKNPIETGSNVADHITLDNDRLTIEGIVTDNPLTLIQSVQTVLSSSRTIKNPINAFEQGQTVVRQVGSVGRLLVNNESRVENTFRYLEEIHKNRVPFSIVTGLKRYKDMVLSSLSIPQTSADGDSIKFSATFEQIDIVKSQLTVISIEDVADDVKHTAQKYINAGKQPTVDASPETVKKSSIVFGLMSKVF